MHGVVDINQPPQTRYFSLSRLSAYVHFRDTAAFDRALDLLTVRTTAGAFSFRKLAETFSNMKAMTEAMDTPLGTVFDTVTAPRAEQFLFIHDHYKNL